MLSCKTFLMTYGGAILLIVFYLSHSALTNTVGVNHYTITHQVAEAVVAAMLFLSLLACNLNYSF